MAIIDYADKVALNTNDSIPDINKVNATDMKELKNAFNNQVAQGWYKMGINPTFTFVSYDSETLTGVVSSDLDMTPYLSVGMKVKFTQNATIKYGIIVAISSTQITLFMGTDYTLLNAVITNAFYSMLKAPYGFPMDNTKWTVIKTDTTNRAQASPVANTWYNLGTVYIDIPVGLWKVKYSLLPYSYRLAADNKIQTEFTLSTTNNSVTDASLSGAQYGGLLSAAAELGLSVAISRPLLLNLTADTRYYMLTRTIATNIGSINNQNATQALYIIAECAYL